MPAVRPTGECPERLRIARTSGSTLDRSTEIMSMYRSNSGPIFPYPVPPAISNDLFASVSCRVGVSGEALQVKNVLAKGY
jgi:hypothetical protein